MKHFFLAILIFGTCSARAERVGIDLERIFRDQSFMGLEVKCVQNQGFGCLAVEVLFEGTPITRTIDGDDTYLDTEEYGKPIEAELSPTVSCKGGDQLKWPARSHMSIRYCVNKKTPIAIGKTFLILLDPGVTTVDFFEGKRDEFKRDLKRVDLTYTYLRAIMFHDEKVLGTLQDARRIGQYLQRQYPRL